MKAVAFLDTSWQKSCQEITCCEKLQRTIP